MTPTTTTFTDVTNAINDLVTSQNTFVQASANKNTTSSAALAAITADTSAGQVLQGAESDLQEKLAALDAVVEAYEATLPPAAPPASA